ncbi:MAG: DUF167 domain-containing protein [Spirochaetes bacterium]|nr:DUF167 domain-containing protein [Spirochaetota bacterium]
MKLKSEQDYVFDVTVVPKASRTEIKLDQSNDIKVYLTSAPVDGKANAELLKLLSKILKVPRTSIKILKGDKGRNKKLMISNFSEKELVDKLTSK